MNLCPQANPKKANVLIEYNAVLHQTSGEDWNNIAVSLSTAQPSMVAAPPVLEPMNVTLTSHRRKMAQGRPGMTPSQQAESQTGQFVSRTE